MMMSEKKTTFDEWQNEVGSFTLCLSEDETQGWLSVLPGKKEIIFSDEELLAVLKEHGVTVGLDWHALLNCSKDITAGQRVDDVLIATGSLPVPRENARLEFFVRVSTSTPEYDHLEGDGDGVDYHQAHLFENVVEGQGIATLLPAESGTDGVSVRGHPVPVPELEAGVPIVFGSGVELRNESDCVATLAGRVLFEEGTVSVTDELEIHTDVDYEVGDIDFVGSVHVQGSVRSGFRVRAGKGLVVDHEVGHCVIESAGDIQIGGVNGREEGATITCGGCLTAKYLHDTVVECSGHVNVTNEVINCTIHSLGIVSVPGLIAGGVVVARMGIEAGRLGTDAGVRTFLEAGVDYRVLDELKQPLAELRIIQDELLSFAKLLGEDREDEADQDIWEERVDDLHNQQCELEDTLRSIRGRCGGIANAMINVNRCIFEGVVIRLGLVQSKIDEYRKGEYSIIEHRHRSLAFLPHSPFARNARELEDELIQQEKEAFEAQ